MHAHQSPELELLLSYPCLSVFLKFVKINVMVDVDVVVHQLLYVMFTMEILEKFLCFKMIQNQVMY